MTVEHIEERNGGLYVKGKRISVDSILYAFRRGESPESIMQNFCGLTLADVYGVISYALDNPVEMDAYLAKQSALWDELKAKHPLPSAFKARLEERARSLAALAPSR